MSSSRGVRGDAEFLGRMGVSFLECLKSLHFAGDLLIIMAQVIIAIQMVLEEKFVYKHNVHPLQAVGTEGMGPEGCVRVCVCACVRRGEGHERTP